MIRRYTILKYWILTIRPVADLTEITSTAKSSVLLSVSEELVYNSRLFNDLIILLKRKLSLKYIQVDLVIFKFCVDCCIYVKHDWFFSRKIDKSQTAAKKLFPRSKFQIRTGKIYDLFLYFFALSNLFH